VFMGGSQSAIDTGHSGPKPGVLILA